MRTVGMDYIIGLSISHDYYFKIIIINLLVQN